MPGAAWITTTGSTWGWYQPFASTTVWTSNSAQDWARFALQLSGPIVEQRFAEETRLRNDEREQERQAERERYEAATERAFATFVSFLDEENRERFAARGHVIITGSAGGRYQIRRGYSGNVSELSPGGRVIRRYCAHPPMHTRTGRLPEGDAMTTQLLKLLTDEPGFIEIANVV